MRKNALCGFNACRMDKLPRLYNKRLRDVFFVGKTERQGIL